MRRDQLAELHFITPTSNVISILRQGILCNRLAEQQRGHQSVAMPEMQERRAKKIVPGGRRLHEYTNLYLHARNPMLYLRKHLHAELCVLRVSPQVLDLPDTVITSQNAASDYVAFYPSPQGLAKLDYELVFAEYWTHPDDPIFEYQHKSIKCAEVLVPNRVNSSLIKGAYVSNATTQTTLVEQLRTEKMTLDVRVNSHLFFQGGRP